MPSPRQFAVVQKDLTSPTPDQVKNAFRAFNNLTEADAVRLAVGAHGILMRQLPHDAARAFQQSLQAEGVQAAIVAEDELPKLPEARVLHRLELKPEALSVYDLMGRATPISWDMLALVAAASVRHFEVSRMQTERTVMGFSPVVGVWPKKVTESGPKVESDSQMLLEILLADGTTRYQIDAAHFPFNYVIDRPGLSTSEKYVWLVQEICRRSPRAMLNAGARWLRAGHEPLPDYASRQALTDEMIWLLWQAGEKKRTAPL